jgi:PAS domain S-box-containing protein
VPHIQPIPSLREVQLSTLLDSMPEAVFLVDTNSRIIEMNRAAEHLSGHSLAATRGKHIRELGPALGIAQKGDGDPELSLGICRALRGEVVRHQRRFFSGRGGAEAMHAIVSACPVRDHRNERELLGALVIVRDITEITELQHVVSDTERHLVVGQMAAGIAHDFSNVLNSITQAATLLDLKQEAPSAERQPYVGMIRTAATRGIEIIHRIRDTIVGSKGETSLISAEQLLEDALEMARPLWSRIPGLSVKRNYHPLLPLRVNVPDLRRAFTNLIINAIQAMPHGGKLVLSCGIKNDRALVSVEDSGGGIPGELQQKIFSPYFTTKQGGTGLGLSGAQRIIQGEGGRIFFKSEQGKGTKFYVELPTAGSRAEPRKAA